MAQQPTRGSNYTVQAGDTLWAIAQRAYNDAEDWDTIYQANKQVIGGNPNLIYPGQVLHIPQNPDPNKTPVPTPPTPTPTPKQPPDDGGILDTIEDTVEDAIKKELGEKKED